MKKNILILTLTSLCVLSSLFLLNYCSGDGSSIMRFLFKNSEKEIELWKLAKSENDSIVVKFELPAEHRSWPLYIKDEGSNNTLKGTVKLLLVNHSDADLIIVLREINENTLREKRVKKGEELLIYSGDLKTLIYELNKGHRVRPNEGDEYYSEWHPLISMSSADDAKLRGEVLILSEDLMEISGQLVFYTYLPPETL